MDDFQSKRPTIIDVARLAGVAPQTVSNVIHRLKKPRPETLRRVTEAIDSLGYHPNAAAKALRSQRTETIALLLEDSGKLGIHDPLHGEFLQGVCNAARKAGQTVIVDFLQPKDIAEHARRLLQDRKAGSLIFSIGLISEARHKFLSEIAKSELPIVLLQQKTTIPGICTIRARDREGARLAVDHLHKNGHREVLMLHARPEWPGPLERRLGVQEQCHAHNMELIETCCKAYTVSAARDAIQRISAANARFSAVIAVNDVLALGAIAQLQQVGRRVPEDCAVIGFNDFNFSSWVKPTITSVQIPGQAMGESATKVIADLLAGSEPIKEIMFSSKLIIRESSNMVVSSE
jgi:DNA-binding LacI/PurR family transcriptional regulator